MYAGSQPQNSKNSTSVWQYDVACLQVSQHQPGPAKGGASMATYPQQQQRSGLRSWSRWRWLVIAVVLIAIIVAIVVLLTYTGGSSGGGGGGGGGY
jgi:hypothetical protein